MTTMASTKKEFLNVSKKNIWNFKQNHPELVIQDVVNSIEELQAGSLKEVENIIRKSLLARGVNKWLKVRLDLIQYKRALKQKIRDKISEIHIQKNKLTNLYQAGEYSQEFVKEQIRLAYLRGQLSLLEQIRIDLKELCMTDRWQEWQGESLKTMTKARVSDDGSGVENYKINDI